MIFVNIDAITEYILSITPAIAALMGVIVVVAVGVGKIKNALKDNGEIVEKSSSRNTKAIEILNEQNRVLKEENRELKKSLVELNKKIDIIDTIKAVRKE